MNLSYPQKKELKQGLSSQKVNGNIPIADDKERYHKRYELMREEYEKLVIPEANKIKHLQFKMLEERMKNKRRSSLTFRLRNRPYQI